SRSRAARSRSAFSGTPNPCSTRFLTRASSGPSSRRPAPAPPARAPARRSLAATPRLLRRGERLIQGRRSLRALERLNDVAVGVQHECRRQAIQAVLRPDLLARIAKDRIVPARLRDELARAVGCIAPIHTHQRRAAVELLGELLELRRLVLARRTPARPEVDERRLPSEGCQVDALH